MPPTPESKIPIIVTELEYVYSYRFEISFLPVLKGMKISFQGKFEFLIFRNSESTTLRNNCLHNSCDYNQNFAFFENKEHLPAFIKKRQVLFI
jgi:hypothetical protein